MPHETAATLDYEILRMIDKFTVAKNINGKYLLDCAATLLSHWECSPNSFPVTGPSDISYTLEVLNTGLLNSANAKLGLEEIDCGWLLNQVVDQLLYIYEAYSGQGSYVKQEKEDGTRRSRKH